MKPSVEILHRIFREANNTYFKGKLPPVEIRIGRATTTLGKFVHLKYPKERTPAGCHISISGYFDLPEQELADTLIHEMIHYYIWLFNVPDSSTHGCNFRKIMNAINRDPKRNISVTGNVDRNLFPKKQRAMPREYYLCLTKSFDGRIFITRCAKTRVFEIHRLMEQWDIIDEIKWYFSSDPWFNSFPLSRTASLYKISDEEIKKYLTVAVELVCDGRVLRPK